ncbi:hypothetical protein Q604_UNBC03952G0001, partial [human gut metagenome]
DIYDDATLRLSRAFDICQFQPLRDIFRGIFKALQRIHGAWNRARKNAR